MSDTSSKLPPVDMGKIVDKLGQVLFPEPMTEEEEDLQTFAILDGASVPELLDHLYTEEDRPQFACLYRGNLEPDMAEVAPYLVCLEPGHEFTEWLVSEGWGKHWGVFVRTSASMKVLQRHLRKFLRVKDPEGNTLVFRYYDPRVARVFFPTCNKEEIQQLFGPIENWVVEDALIANALELVVLEEELTVRSHNLLTGVRTKLEMPAAVPKVDPAPAAAVGSPDASEGNNG